MPSRRSLLTACAVGLAGCLGAERPTEELIVSSPAFADGDPYPPRFTCQGAGVSPPLAIESVPPPTEALAVVVENPFAVGSTVTHWLLWGVPPATTEIPAAVPRTETVDSLGGAKQGRNGSGEIGYHPPCPSPGESIDLWITLHALRRPLDLPPGSGRDAVDDELEGAAIAGRQLRATYSRPAE